MNEKKVKRSLILAGGGVKVAFQAGVLQVWLDEANLPFDHVDGASGGVFNLAMYCQGLTGRQIADNWRNLDPKLGVDFNWQQYIKLFYAESLFTLDNYRQHVFPAWGLNWDQIKSSAIEATFNVYNFSKHRLEVVNAANMSEDYLVAAVSLPMWFPPAVINGSTYIDSVFITDANIEEAIRRGADEIWVIWTVSDSGKWRNGFVANYFQIIETSANGHFNRILNRIDENNQAIASGKTGEFGRHIDVKILRAEVPLHYLINFSKDRLAEAVNLGVKTAKSWCREHGIDLEDSTEEYPTEIHTAPTQLRFSEEMKGFVTAGETDFQKGFEEGKKHHSRFSLQLTIHIDGVNRFITHPEHEALITGYVNCDDMGGRLPVEKGYFNLFVDHDKPENKRMWYLIYFKDSDGQPFTFIGFKVVEDDPDVDMWSDTTTLYSKIYKGYLKQDQAKENAEIYAAGIIKIHFMDFIRQLTTFRVEGPTFSDRMGAMTDFAKMFFGKLWDVYAKDVLTYAPF